MPNNYFFNRMMSDNNLTNSNSGDFSFNNNSSNAFNSINNDSLNNIYIYKYHQC